MAWWQTTILFPVKLFPQIFTKNVPLELNQQTIINFFPVYWITTSIPETDSKWKKKLKWNKILLVLHEMIMISNDVDDSGVVFNFLLFLNDNNDNDCDSNDNYD